MSAGSEKLKQNEIAIALAFARVELLEIEAGTRTLGQCPGLENVGRYIAEYKARNLATPAPSGFNATYDANARRRNQYGVVRNDRMCNVECEGHSKGTCTLAADHGGSHWFPNMWNDQ